MISLARAELPHRCCFSGLEKVGYVDLRLLLVEGERDFKFWEVSSRPNQRTSPQMVECMQPCFNGYNTETRPTLLRVYSIRFVAVGDAAYIFIYISA